MKNQKNSETTSLTVIASADVPTDPDRPVTTITVLGVDQAVTAGQMAGGVPGALRREMATIMRATRYAAMVADGLASLEDFSAAEQRDIRAVHRSQGYAPRLARMSKIDA